MKWIVAHIKWIMLVSGILTTTMLYAAIAPNAALQSNFGHGLEGGGRLAELIVRNWGILIGLIGAMLIYGAFDPPGRPFILTIAGLSKAAFVVLLLTVGRDYLSQPIRGAVVVDAIWVLVFAAYLAATRTRKTELPATALLAAVAALFAAACGKEAPKTAAPPAAARPLAPTTPAEYTVIVKSTWTKTTHPFEYPSGAHFSGIIGASHNTKYSIFAVGRRPTPGLERLSEEGKHSPLDTEIRTAIDQGNALMMFETGGLKNWRDSLVTTVRVDPAHTFVSAVNMVAPSPDWFTGVSSVNLVDNNGAWVTRRTLTLPAYDSGGDDGRTYKAPDRDTNPKKATSRAATRHFVVNGKVRPVATVTFVRKSP